MTKIFITAVTLICMVCTLWGAYELGIRADNALNSNGPEYSKILRNIKARDCKYEYQQTVLVDEPQIQVTGTQIDDLIEKVAIRICTMKQHNQMHDTAVEAFKLVNIKGVSGAAVTIIDQFKGKEVDKCEASMDLLKLMCPNTLKNAGYKDLD